MDWIEGYTVEERDGFAFAKVVPGPVCPHCRGDGRRSLERDGIKRVGRCRCQVVPDRVKLYNAANVPARHARCTVESFETKAARVTVSGVRAWLDTYEPHRGDQHGLIIYGLPGRGKTHLACAMLRELVFRHGVPARFVEFTHLLATIREGYDRNEGEARLLGPLVRVPILVIDELGKGKGTDFEKTILDEIISRRYNARSGPIIATTNFPARSPKPRRDGDSLATGAVTTLPEVLGDRVWSRLAEGHKFVEAVGEDYRIVKGKN